MLAANAVSCRHWQSGCVAHIICIMADTGQTASPDFVALRAEGRTRSERYLAKLCEKTFLSLWSYPAVFRDQGRRGEGDGKEVCDLLVVFENHILIFSDKDCRFHGSGDLQVDWTRWFKKAVKKSVDQIFGAERWIKQFPDRLFLDRQCKVPFPINLPDPEKRVFHRIVIAHDASRACKEHMGGSGSLVLTNEPHFADQMPFTVGPVSPEKGFVHILDDTSLDIVMRTVDTITDFVRYLTKKERFLTGTKAVMAAGEEELLAIYLRRMNDAGEHDFVFEGNYDGISIDEGFWDAFVKSPQRQAQIDADHISYSWDALINTFTFHAMSGTQFSNLNGHSLRDQEIVYRFLAREPRTRRRFLATRLHELLERSKHSKGPLVARVLPPSNGDSPHYVFVFLKRPAGLTDERYRRVRMNVLADYCRVTKLRFPEATDIIGFASEAGSVPQRSEDLIYVDTRKWSAKDEAKAREIQKKLGFLTKVKVSARRVHEYPVNHQGVPRKTTLSRNSPCPCGSRKRFKNCHGA